jgi:hypothetical protein
MVRLYSAWESHPTIPKQHKSVPKYEKCAGVQLQYVLVHTIVDNFISAADDIPASLSVVCTTSTSMYKYRDNLNMILVRTMILYQHILVCTSTYLYELIWPFLSEVS